jgi:hypothetical protein
MVASNDEERQGEEWDALYARIKTLLSHWGVEDYIGRSDYFIVDDNYGYRRQTIEIHNLKMLNPKIVDSLRGVLKDFPGWEIVVVVDIPGKEKAWPPMGVTVRGKEIIDGLQRQYLPDEFRNVYYFGARPGTGYD